MRLSAFSSSPSPPTSGLLFFVSSLSTVPCSCSCSPCLFLLLPLPPPYEAPDTPIQGRFYPGRSSAGPPPPGCSSPSAFLPRMFQSGFHVLVRLSFFSFSSLFPTLVLRVLSLYHSWLLFMFSLPFLAATAPSSLCSPGRFNPGPPCPRMFQTGCVASPDDPVRVP